MNKHTLTYGFSLIILLGSILTIGLSPNISRAQTLQTPELDIDFTSRYTLVWTDKGSGSAADVSFWRPEPTAGWFRVGHHIKRGYGNPTELTMVVRGRASGALARPVDYFPVWDDTGSGAQQDGSVWRPSCPRGFRAMGDVTSRSHAKPALDEVVCLQQNSLGATIPGNAIWNDAGSGSARDFTAWNIVSPASDARFNYASSGLFLGSASRSRPQASSIGGIWAVRLPRAGGGTPPPVNASGGSVEQQFWDAIKNSQRTQDYQSYLQNFPNGQFAALARLKIDQLSPGSQGSIPPTQSPFGGSAADQQFWDAVKNSQRVADYQTYLQNFPNGQFTALARLKIDQLNQSAPVQLPSSGGSSVDEQFWDSIKTSQRTADFQSYLRNFPNGQFAALARLRIDQLGQSAPPVSSGTGLDQQFWDSIKDSRRVSDYQSYLRSFPNGQFAALARLKLDQLQVSTSQGPVISQNAALLNQLAADNRAKLPILAGDVQLFDAVSVCQSGCQQSGGSESIVIRAKTPNLTKQRVSIGQVEQTLKPAMLKGYCGSPEQTNNVTFNIDVDDMFNQKIGSFFINARDCAGTFGTSQPPASTPPLTGFQQIVAAAQPGSINEIARARTFFVVSNDFSIKNKIAKALTKALPQLRAATSEQTADFLIGFELTDRKTGLVTPNDSSNPDLRGELIVFTVIRTPGRPEAARILFRVTKERGFGVFSATPDENAAKEFAKQLAKVII